MERVTGIEPALKAWEALILPLNYTRFTRGQFTIKNMIKSIKKLSMSHKQKTSLFCREVFHMGRMIGFEPTTPGTTNRCSNQLSYIRHRLYEFLQNIFVTVKQNINDGTIYLYLLFLIQHKSGVRDYIVLNLEYFPFLATSDSFLLN